MSATVGVDVGSGVEQVAAALSAYETRNGRAATAAQLLGAGVDLTSQDGPASPCLYERRDQQRVVRTEGDGGGHGSAGSLLDDATPRRATSRPACQPGARPFGGGRRSSVDRPAVAISQAATEFEFHISPASSSSTPTPESGRR
jgi:hypothetical protein